MTDRLCLSCGTDISNLHGNARRCMPCQAALYRKRKALAARPPVKPFVVYKRPKQQASIQRAIKKAEKRTRKSLELMGCENIIYDDRLGMAIYITRTMVYAKKQEGR